MTTFLQFLPRGAISNILGLLMQYFTELGHVDILTPSLSKGIAQSNEKKCNEVKMLSQSS